MSGNLSDYFPSLDSLQIDRFTQLESLYREWNAKINVISRKDIGNLFIHHILFSLSIGKIIRFSEGTKIMDIGTGGGLPGIPLAILFPEADFTLVDSIGKKIHVVENIVMALGLKNVHAVIERFEKMKGSFDFITGRAVINLPEIVSQVSNKILPVNKNEIPNGILYLKGGEFNDELSKIDAQKKIYNLSAFFIEPFFETKKVVHIYQFRNQ